MSMFIVAIALLAWRWPIASLVVAGVLVEYCWEGRKAVYSMETRVDPRTRLETQYRGMCMKKGCTNKRTGADNLCDDHSIKTGSASFAGPTLHPTHTCPISGCNETVVYAKLMCWKHWAKVPDKLRAPVYQSWNNGEPTADHARRCTAAIDAVKAVLKKK